MSFFRFNLKSHLTLHLLILAIGTLVFRYTDLDLQISDYWYQHYEGRNWGSTSDFYYELRVRAEINSQI